MTPRALLPALTVIAAVALAGCGSGGGTASDPEGTGTPTSPAATATVASTPATPSASPTVGTYPSFDPTDYSFDLVVSCFCAGANTPMQVTVLHAKVVGAIYLQDGTGRGGATKGDPVDKIFWLSINDVIAKANDVTADRVKVDWPDGQAYPSSVYVDPDRNAADEEVSYSISDVRVDDANY